jgi:hypothetical protein
MSNNKKEKGYDYSSGLIWAAALVGMIRYAAAFLASDVGEIVGVTSEIITLLLGISGFAMGMLSTFGTAYLFDGWRRKMPATGTKWPFKFTVLTVFVFAAFVFELAILVPFTVSRMQHASMTEVLNGGVWWWSIAVNIMPLLLIGGVSVGNQIVSVSSSESSESGAKVSEKVSDGEGKVSENFPKDWRKVLPFLSAEELMAITQMSTKEIQEKYYLKTPKSALNWRKYAQAEVQKIELAKQVSA